MLSLSATPMSPTALPMNAFNLSVLTDMMHRLRSNSAHSLPLARGCQVGTNGVEYRFEHEPAGRRRHRHERVSRQAGLTTQLGHL